MKKIPLRTCVITHEQFPKKELLRVVKTPQGEIVIDETGRTNGRGAYLKKDIEVIKKARISKALEKHLEASINDELYNQLEKMI